MLKILEFDGPDELNAFLREHGQNPSFRIVCAWSDMDMFYIVFEERRAVVKIACFDSADQAQVFLDTLDASMVVSVTPESYNHRQWTVVYMVAQLSTIGRFSTVSA